MSSRGRGAAAGEFQVMGIVNVTPDSFSDGGLYLNHRPRSTTGSSSSAPGR